MSARATMSTTAQTRLYAALLVLVGALVWASGIDGVFLYDDYDSIVLNPHIQHLWPLSEAMSRPLAGAAETVSTRPLLSLTFALDHALHGFDVTGYHVVNVSIHLACALLLLVFLRRTMTLQGIANGQQSTRTVGLAFVVALLWMLHPIQTSAVTYVVQRAESLGALFLLIALYASLRAAAGPASDREPASAATRATIASPSARAWSLTAVAACWMGAGAKETVAAAPILALVHHATFVDRSYRAALARRWRLYAAMASSWILLWTLRAPDTAELAGNGLSYAITQPGVLLYYLRLVLWPHPLALSYDWPASAPAAALLPGSIVATLVFATAWGVITRAWWGFAGAVFFGVLAPSSSIFDLTQRIMEHRMYLPSAAVITLVVLGTDSMLHRIGAKSPAAETGHGARVGAGDVARRWALVVVVGLALAGATVMRNREYANEVDFWRDNVAAQPADAIAHLQLGRAYLRAGAVAEARASFERAISVGPPFAPLYNDLARTLIAEGDLTGARVALERALALDPRLAVAHNNLGLVQERSGDAEAAAESYRRALDLDNTLAVTRENLARLAAISGNVAEPRAEASSVLQAGASLERSGRLDEAQARYESAVAGDASNLEARNALATLLARRGRFAEAEAAFAAVLARDPDNVDAHRNLGALHASLGRDAEAVEHLRRVLALAPDAARAHFNLGLLYERRGDLEHALREFSGEIAVSPEFAAAHVARGRVLEKTGRNDQARAAYQTALDLSPELVEARDGLERTREASRENGS